MRNYFKIKSQNKRVLLYYVVLYLALLLIAIIVSSIVAERNDPFWQNTENVNPDLSQIKAKGFFMADVSDLLLVSGLRNDKEKIESESIPLAIGPGPSLAPLTPEEIKLYGVLSKFDGLLTEEITFELDEDIYWQEVVLKKRDTLDSLAKEFGVTVEDIRKANNMKENQSPSYSEVIYIPDSSKYVQATLDFVKKMEQAAVDATKQAKQLSIIYYTVKEGDSLWTIADKFDLKVDSIVGSNKLNDINLLKIGIQLRIPNQDGVFVKYEKNTNLDKFADKYGSTKDGIYFANKLREESEIKVGQELFLPGGSIASTAETVPARQKRQGLSRMVKSKPKVSSERFGWPVFGRISSSFGWRRSPFGKRRVFHAGIDIRAPKGRNIVAAQGGRVVHSGWMGGYGYTIVLSHPSGVSTLYGHCSALLVSKGANVKKGQLIARVGSTGRSTGNHLHFEVRQGGSPVNPMRFLR